MISTLFIDVDDTLLDFPLCARQSMSLALSDRGIEFQDSFFHVFTEENNKLWRRVEDGALTVEELYQIRWNIIFARLGLDFDGVDFERDFIKNLHGSAIPVEGAVELLEYLHGRYVLCIASNAPYEQQRYRLESAGMLKFFDRLFVSGDLGFAKPQPDFFRACLDRLPGVGPENCMIIGDSLNSDIRGGKNAGMLTCWLDRYSTTLPRDISPDYRVESLAEIKGIL